MKSKNNRKTNIKKQLLKQKKGKPLLNINILSSRFHIQKKHLMFSFLVLTLFLLNKRYFLFSVLTIFSGIFSYYHDMKNRTPIDFKMALFLGIFITRYYGLPYTLVFFILSDIVPSLLGGGQIEGASLLFIGWFFIVNSLVLLFPNSDIIYLGVILVIIETLGSVFINTFRGFPGVVAFLSSIFSLLARIGYFLTLGSLLRILFNII